MTEQTPRYDKQKTREVKEIVKRTGRPIDIVSRTYDEVSRKVYLPRSQDRIKITEKALHYADLDSMRNTYRARIRRGDTQIDFYAPEDTSESDPEETAQTLSSLVNATLEAVCSSPRTEKEQLSQIKEVIDNLTPEQISDLTKRLGKSHKGIVRLLIGIDKRKH